MNAPTISVLMPVYNAGPYLAEATQSILNQTFQNFEFIIVNDGSTDDSLDILRLFTGRDGRIILVDRPNGGYSSALNQALELARGEFVARMDADDFSFPTRFARQIEYLKQHLNCVAVGAKALMVDQEGDSLSVIDSPSDHETIDREHLKAIGGQILHPSVMIRREALKEIGGYRTNFEPAEDLDLFLRLAEMGVLANLTEILIKYRVHPTCVSVTRRKLQLRNSNLAVCDAYLRRGLALPSELALKKDEELPKETMLSSTDHRNYYARIAIESGFLKTARKHARRIWLGEPWQAASWFLMLRAMTGIKKTTASTWVRRIGLANPAQGLFLISNLFLI